MKVVRRLVMVAVLLFCLTERGVSGTLVQFQLYFGLFNPVGEVDVEMYDHDKPITVANFLKLIQAGAYQQSFFHRLVPGFVLQGGSYYVANPFVTNIVAPPFANIGAVPTFGTIKNEFHTGKFYSNTNWTISMAKTSDPDSASAGFFFNIANNASSLDNTNNSGGFTVFGHVVRGTNILNGFNALGYGNGLINLANNYGTNGFFTELPMALAGTDPPPYYELVYFTVNTLTLKVNVVTNGVRQISWTTVNGVTNNVEFATNLPPVWQVLMSTNGNGLPLTVLDTTTNVTRRFYRVHLLF